MPKDNEAIQTDVDLEGVDVEGADVEAEQDVESPAEKQLSGREKIMADIESKRRDELREEGVELSEEEPEPEGELPDLPEVKAEKDVEPEGEAEVKIKVNGEDSTVTEKAIREYQKNIAADKRLEDLNARSKSLEGREKALADAEAQAKKLINDANVKAQKEAVAIDDDVAEKLSEAILTENKSDVAKILGQVVQAAQAGMPVASAANDVKPLDIDNAVKKAVNANRYETQVDEARDKFATEHKDLADSPVMRKMVNDRVGQLWQTNQEATPWDLFDKAANDVRSEVGKVLGVEAKETPESPQHKKTGVQSAPRRAAGRVNINREAPAPKTTQQTVADLVATRNARLS